MRGLEAYKTYLAMMLHFKGGFDGWTYNFTTKANEEKFAANDQLVYQYAAIERDYPTKTDQIKFFYPAFAELGYVKPSPVIVMHRRYRAFNVEMSKIDWLFEDAINKLIDGGHVETLFDIAKCDRTLPLIYELVDQKRLPYEVAVVLFMTMPSVLNKVMSKEPFVYDKWKAKIDFDKRFYSLYINDPVLNRLKATTVNYLKTGM